jgi:TolB-like protein
MLHGKSANVSEVSYEVGFSSPAYFSACFHEYFGYPPSKITKDTTISLPDENIAGPAGLKKQKKSIPELLRVYRLWVLSFFLAAVGIIIFLYVKTSASSSPDDLRSDDGRIPVAVMPFDNLTGNRTWDCIQMNLISYLSNFNELSVRQKEAVDLLLESRGISSQASLTPVIASTISRKLDSKVYISGVISQAGTRSRIIVQMVNSQNQGSNQIVSG